MSLKNIVQCVIVAFVILSGAYSFRLDAATSAPESTMKDDQLPPENTEANATWHAIFERKPFKIVVGDHRILKLKLRTPINGTSQSMYIYELKSNDPLLAYVDGKVPAKDFDPVTGEWWGSFSVQAYTLGTTRFYVQRRNSMTNEIDRHTDSMQILIIRPNRHMDKAFTSSLLLLVVLLYSKFGADFDVSMMRKIKCPAVALILLCAYFMWMPWLCSTVGTITFRHSPEIQIGLFLTGILPNAGTMSVYNSLVGGKIDLSRSMTTIANFVTFATMPFWLYTYGRSIVEPGQMKEALVRIAAYAVGLVGTLAFSVGLKYRWPRYAHSTVRRLNRISTILIIFIIGYTLYTNRTLFQMYAWKIGAATLALTWLGFFVAWLSAKLVGQSSIDALRIGFQTSMQNSGIPICLLHFTLPQPQSDEAIVIPVAVAATCALSLIGISMYKRISQHSFKDQFSAFSGQHSVAFEMLGI